MTIQSYGYGGSGLFGQPSFGDYSGLSRGVPVPMTPEEIQYQLLRQDVPDYQNVMDMYFGTPNTSSFNANVNSRPTGRELPMNPYVYPNFLPPVSRMDYTQGTAVEPVEAVNQISVTNDSNANLPPAPKGKMWEFDANSNQYVLVDDPLSNLSEDASQTTAVASSPQVAMPAPALSAPASTSSSIVQGMFPEVEAMQRALYQQKQNEAMQAQAMQFARLSPMQQAQYSLYMGGQQLGGAIGSALGGKDPQLQLISMRNAISRQIDMRDPTSYYKAATLANQAGDREFATSLVDAGRKLELDTSLIQQRTREKQAADPFQQLLRTGKYTPASMAAYEISKNVADLREIDNPDKIPARIQEAKKVAISKGFPEGTAEHDAEVVKYLEKSEKEPSVGSDREAIAKDMFFKPFSQLTQEQIKAVNAKKKKDDIDAAQAGTSQQQKQDKVILANKAKLAETVETEAYGAEDRLTLARNLKTLLPQAFTGVGSDVVLEASRLAEVFGINIQGVPSSQIIDTILGELTIGAASNLKGSLSDKDVRFLKETIGTRGLSIRTLQYVADRIEENALIDNGVNNSLATYLKDGNDLNEYNFPAERKKVTEQIRKDKKRLQELREKQQKSK